MKACIIIIEIVCLLVMPTSILWGKDSIKLAITNLPPFQIVDGNQVKDCINVRVLKKILDPMDIEITYQVMPFKRCLMSLKKGKSDIFMGILRRPERESYLYYVQPPYKQYSNKAFFLPRGKAKILQQYEDLYKLKVGIRSGFKYFPKFDSDERIDKEPGKSNEINLRKLHKARIEALAITEITGEYLIALHGYDFEKAPFKYSQTNPAYLVISKKSRFMKRLEEFEKYSQIVSEENIYEEVEKAFLDDIREVSAAQR